MKIDIIHSTIDVAGINLRTTMNDLIQDPPEGGWPLLSKHKVTFREWDEHLVNADDEITSQDADLVIFLARHASIKPLPMLTIHPAGNFTTADLGGNPCELGFAAPVWMRAILRNYQKYVPEGFHISYEITHHGPTNIHTPYFFVEVGSTETEWWNMDAIHAVAISVLMADPGEEIIPLIGFGGTHYAIRQTAIALETRGAFGHMMHTRNIADVDVKMIQQMMTKSGAIAAYIDKKAMSKSEATHIEKLLAELGIFEVTEGDLRKMGTIPWKIWTKFSSFAKDIDPTIRLFPHGKIGTGEPVSIILPENLFSEAFGGREEVLFAELDRLNDVFHTTDKNGKVLPILLTIASRRQNIAGDLIALSVQQITRTQGTTVEGNHIIITSRLFDSRLARTQGVPSGPLFGKLAAGESVKLPDGRTVTPEMVTKTVQSTIHIPRLENYS
jgi:D-aminoacyl-tRNA deacylase